MAQEAKKDLASGCQGVSRRHGQGYFARLSYNKLYPSQLEPLITACARSQPITSTTLLVSVHRSSQPPVLPLIEQVEVAVLAADTDTSCGNCRRAADRFLGFKLPFDRPVSGIKRVDIGVGTADVEHAAGQCRR